MKVGPAVIKIWPTFKTNLKNFDIAWLELCTPEGRKYLHTQLDVVLDFLVLQIKPKVEEPEP